MIILLMICLVPFLFNTVGAHTPFVTVPFGIYVSYLLYNTSKANEKHWRDFHKWKKEQREKPIATKPTHSTTWALWNSDDRIASVN